MKVSTINELQEDLCRMYEDLRSGKIEAKDAVEINNTAGKIISASKVQLAYHALRGEAPFVPFLATRVDKDAANPKLKAA